MSSNENSNWFGNPDQGYGISNKDTLLEEINRSLNVSSNPDIEIILADATIKNQEKSLIKRIGAFIGRFGHIAIRYRIPSDMLTTNIHDPNCSNHDRSSGAERAWAADSDVVMNIVGLSGSQMVNFIESKDYFFEMNNINTGNEQGGIYNRHFYSLRIENVNKNVLRTLHSYYVALLMQSKLAKASKFRLIGGRIGQLTKYIPFINDITGNYESFTMEGNCAIHVSNGLVFSGLLQRKRIFPKAIFVDLYEKQMLIDPNNINIVEYKEINHKNCFKFYPGYKCVTSLVNPLTPLRNYRFYNLSQLANVVVFVPDEMLDEISSVHLDKRQDVNNVEVKGVVKKNTNVVRPSVSFVARHTHSLGIVFLVVWILFSDTFFADWFMRVIFACWIIFLQYWIY